MGRTGGSFDDVSDAVAVAAVRDALASVAPAGTTVVLAVSGGRDSVGMAVLVTAARPDLHAVVAHVRHGLRDDAADAAAAQACAAALNLPCRVIAVTVVADGTGPENAARTARLNALAAAAQEAGAALVLTGHTADDQAETVLMNLARGAGLGGLAGIPAVRGLSPGVRLVRPVLGLRREMVRAVAADSGLPVVDDPSNADPSQPRAIARSQLLPLLQQLTGGGSDPVAALARLAGHARAEVATLDTLAAEVADRLLNRWAGIVTVPTSDLDALPGAIALRVLRQMVSEAGSAAVLSEAGYAALRRLEDGQSLTLAGGLLAGRGGGWLAVAPATQPLPPRPVADDGVALPEIGLMLHREPSPGSGHLPPWAPARAASAVPVAGTADLVVRSRRPGDRIVTAAGTQLLADAMISAGVPRLARDLVPVVADERGPLWVPGVAVRARSDATTGQHHLRFGPLDAQVGLPTW